MYIFFVDVDDFLKFQISYNDQMNYKNSEELYLNRKNYNSRSKREREREAEKIIIRITRE